MLKYLDVSEQTYYRWRKRYGELSLDDAKRLHALEGQNRGRQPSPASNGLPRAVRPSTT